jgi:hypothetical protein
LVFKKYLLHEYLSRNIFEKHETKDCAENIAPAFLAM